MAITGRSNLLRLLGIVLAIGFLSCGACSPKPFINSISPNVATAGRNQFLFDSQRNGPSSRLHRELEWFPSRDDIRQRSSACSGNLRC